jgi:hypothetical protein
MKPRLVIGASLTLVLLAGGIWADAGLKSGPQPGQRVPGPFNPLNVTGDNAGEKTCQV